MAIWVIAWIGKFASVDFSSCRQAMSGRADFNHCNKLSRRRLMLLTLKVAISRFRKHVLEHRRFTGADN